MIRLDLLNVGLVEETGGVLLVLRAPELARLLVIETGIQEGEAIALEAEGERAERPLTQDILYDTIRALGATVAEVQIQDFHDETFYAKIVLAKVDGASRVELDARPSDAVALALRARAPIYVSEQVMGELSIPEDAGDRFADLYDEPPEGRVIH
ncbi:MAG TPA: bifunctional nuclease family protein [Symbiobacteriaceae bacterium]|jgi:hypothetical protein